MDDRCRVASIMLVQASISSLFRKKREAFFRFYYIGGRYIKWNESCGRK